MPNPEGVWVVAARFNEQDVIERHRPDLVVLRGSSGVDR